MKTCCFSGHRNLSFDALAKAEGFLEKTIESVIAKGYTNFISGFANGIDIMAADLVYQFKEYFPKVTLEAMIPYEERLNKKDRQFQTLLRNCDKITVCSKYYFSGCMLKRNNMMIDKSNLLVAVYDGRVSGGTYYTINKAKEKNLEVLILDI